MKRVNSESFGFAGLFEVALPPRGSLRQSRDREHPTKRSAFGKRIPPYADREAFAA
jgi:hypothetical protein